MQKKLSIEQIKKILQKEPPKKSTRAPPNYEDKYPQGMKNFIQSWIKLGWHKQIQDQCAPTGKLFKNNTDMRFVYYYHLIDKFLETKFQKQDMFQKVRDLPDYDRFLAIDCLGCYLGMNPHNGNIHLLQIVKKFKDLQS